MALVKIDERTVVQKIKHFFLGKEKPNLFRRISVVIGFFIWLYFAIWQGLIFLSIVLMNRLQNPEMIQKTFDRVGAKYTFLHRWGLNTTDVLLYHSLGMFVFFGLSLFGLILIYRQKKIGHVLYFITNIFATIFTIILLGMNYFNHEISLIDKIFFSVATLYFGFGIFFFKKKKLEE
jgi:hypothetical protein